MAARKGAWQSGEGLMVRGKACDSHGRAGRGVAARGRVDGEGRGVVVRKGVWQSGKRRGSQ